MRMEELQKRLETENVEFRGNCHECQIPVKVLCSIDNNGNVIISGGSMYNPKFGVPPIEHTFFKCDKCFTEDKVLRNYQECEVYSRVVGYLRPVQQWNKGKVEEFKQRKEFVVK